MLRGLILNTDKCEDFAGKQRKGIGRLEVHKKEFVDLRKQTPTIALNKKKIYYSKKVDECKGNSKSLFARQLLDIKQNTDLVTIQLKSLLRDFKHISEKRL